MYVGKIAVRGYFGQNTMEAAREPRTLPHDVCTRSYGKIAGCVYHSPIRRSIIVRIFEIIIVYHNREITTLCLCYPVLFPLLLAL
jgi:hypothetical protein